MTNEEALKWFETRLNNGVPMPAARSAFQAAIEALRKDVPGTNVGGTVYRQQAIDALGEQPTGWSCGEYEEGLISQWKSDVEAIKQLPSADSELINKLDFGINASTGDSAYMVGLRNGLRLAKSYADGSDPQFEKCAEPKPGEWILDRSGAYCCSNCMEPCATYVMMKPRDRFCKMCGRRNEAKYVQTERMP